MTPHQQQPSLCMQRRILMFPRNAVFKRGRDAASFLAIVTVAAKYGVFARRRPLDYIIKPRDTMVVGWENEFATPEIAMHRNYARTRQVLQWVFAAAPGHPALREICDHIAQNVYTQFSQNTNRDTLERTGPGVFTDYVLKHAAMHPPSKVSISSSSPRKFAKFFHFIYSNA